MARNRSLTVVGNSTTTIEIDGSYLSAFVRSASWISAKPSSGILTIEYLSWDGEWYALRGGLIDLSLDGKQPSPFVEGEVLRQLRVTLSGVPVDAQLEISFYIDSDIAGLSDVNLSTRNDQFNRLKVQALTLAQQYIVSGLGYDWWWRIRALTSSAAGNANRAFVRFTVPADHYMAIDSRFFFTNAQEGYYRVYRPAVINTTGLVEGADVPLQSNLRPQVPIQFANVAQVVTLPTPPDRDLAFIEVPHFEAQGQGNSTRGELDSESVFRLLPPGAIFYIEMANNTAGGTATSYMKASLVVAFIPVDQVPPPG